MLLTRKKGEKKGKKEREKRKGGYIPRPPFLRSEVRKIYKQSPIILINLVIRWRKRERKTHMQKGRKTGEAPGSAGSIDTF